MRIRSSAAALTLAVASQALAQSVLHVPSQFPTIQAAVNAAQNGDTVLVADGVWAGFHTNKSITVRSENGPASCLIDRPDPSESSFVRASGDNMQIRGFTVRPAGRTVIAPVVLTGDDLVLAEMVFERFRTGIYGAAVYLAGNNFLIVDSQVRENSSGDWGYFPAFGAGIAVYGSGTLLRCIIEENRTVNGQGDPAASVHEAGSAPGLIIGGGTVSVVSSIIRNNRCGSGGGVIYCLGPGADGTDGGHGGGIYIQNADVTFINTLIAGNSAGGGANGTSCNGQPPVVHGGNGGNGGGVLAYNATLTFINCTIVGNAAGPAGMGSLGPAVNGRGGGIFAASSTVRLHNTILWGNTAPAVDPFTAQVDSTSQPEMARACIQGLPGTFDPLGNFGLDPLFVQPTGATRDYRLRPNSPCIDAGDNTRLPAGITADLAGAPRFHDDPQSINIGFGPAPIVDVGAYEFQGASCYANCDSSTTAPVLNVEDFTCFINRFASGDPRANCDESVIPPILNVEDFTCFINRFAAGCP
jgi:hypothetical protein